MRKRMGFNSIISVTELADHQDDPDWVIIDSRFKLADPDQGRMDYLTAHIPRAVYAHLNDDLSGPVIDGITGRHPLPNVVEVAEVFSRFGIDSHVQVVAYDDAGGALAAARVWWLLRWLGHENVAVLDGGWQQWLKAGYPVKAGNEIRSRRQFAPTPRHEMVVTVDGVERIRNDKNYRLLDARSADRFRGENETIDPVPGHIPGAISAAYAGNLNPEGTFRSSQGLLSRYKRLINGVPISNVVCYCGSGVTATHDILAMLVAGLGEARLYPGSYSEWITDSRRPVEK
jgi:thiosulfate/3-mercaptopyruvate sulfurtransferase